MSLTVEKIVVGVLLACAEGTVQLGCWWLVVTFLLAPQ